MPERGSLPASDITCQTGRQADHPHSLSHTGYSQLSSYLYTISPRSFTHMYVITVQYFLRLHMLSFCLTFLVSCFLFHNSGLFFSQQLKIFYLHLYPLIITYHFSLMTEFIFFHIIITVTTVVLSGAQSTISAIQHVQ